MSHDWIAYAVTRSKKYKWVIDSNSYILYRQHSLNVQGARLGIMGGEEADANSIWMVLF